MNNTGFRAISHSTVRRLAILALITLCGVSEASPTRLSDEQRERAIAIYDSVSSPYCPGRMLGDCPSSAATTLKEEVRRWIVAGKSDSEIYDELASRYGTKLAAVPPLSGVGLVGWVLPILFLVLALFVGIRALRGLTRTDPS